MNRYCVNGALQQYCPDEIITPSDFEDNIRASTGLQSWAWGPIVNVQIQYWTCVGNPGAQSCAEVGLPVWKQCQGRIPSGANCPSGPPV